MLTHILYALQSMYIYAIIYNFRFCIVIQNNTKYNILIRVEDKTENYNRDKPLKLDKM